MDKVLAVIILSLFLLSSHVYADHEDHDDDHDHDHDDDYDEDSPDFRYEFSYRYPRPSFFPPFFPPYASPYGYGGFPPAQSFSYGFPPSLSPFQNPLAFHGSAVSFPGAELGGFPNVLSGIQPLSGFQSQSISGNFLRPGYPLGLQYFLEDQQDDVSQSVQIYDIPN